jgi:hypothetical protein
MGPVYERALVRRGDVTLWLSADALDAWGPAFGATGWTGAVLGRVDRVESAFFRDKAIISTALRARTAAGRQTEALLACNVLNRMTELGGQSSSVGETSPRRIRVSGTAA